MPLLHGGPTKESPVASFTPDHTEKQQRKMKVWLNVGALSEVVTNQKHPFRKVDNQPKKPLKHRYERRKIKEALHLGDWISGESPISDCPRRSEMKQPRVCVAVWLLGQKICL